MSERWRHSRRLGLTLIEIVVVIGVIAVLVSVLMPCLGHAREAGRGASCAASLRQAGLGLAMYLDDQDGSFFPYYQDIPMPDGGRRWWFGFEPGGPASNPSQKNRAIDKVAGFLGPYMSQTVKDFVCPSFPYASGGYSQKFAPSAGGYGYNIAGLAGFGNGNKLRKLSEIAGKTSDMFALADGIHFDKLDYSSNPPLSQGFNEPAYILWQNPAQFASNAGVNGGYGHFRHVRSANVLYVDGHAAAQPVRRTLHPFSGRGLGPVANLSDDMLRTRAVQQGNAVQQVDVIYGVP